MNRLFGKIISLNLIKKVCYSKYAYSDEFTVSQFCKLHLSCPFKIKVRPLDVQECPTNNKLFIKLQSYLPANDIVFNYSEENDHIFIHSNFEKPNDISCLVQAPISSDLHITTTFNGSINVKQFKGDHIILQTDSGDIVTENCQSSVVKCISKKGNIVTNGTLHAATIELETNESGCIVANHLQALQVTLKTQDGDVRTESCYCDVSNYETQTGKLILNNVHKKCFVNIVDCGILQMTGFDGTLDAKIKSGEADIQLTKLHDISKIDIKEKSPVLIRIAETIVDNTLIKTNCCSLAVPKTFKMQKKQKDSYTTHLTPLNDNYQSQLVINCPTSFLVMEEASWADMFALKTRNF